MLRMTRQRNIILEELRKARTHPTADEIYAKVRRHLPHISLGTVYRNLEILSRAGFVRTLELGGRRKRFDGCVDDHCHVRCLECDRVSDVATLPLAGIERDLGRRSSFKIVGHRIEFIGICPECRKKALKTGKEG
jgi:Fe2+ or Zn2+ uptake regulation protein